MPDLPLPNTHCSGAPYGLLYHSRCKEQFSIAYVHAITTAARCKLENIVVDDESVDATIKQVASHAELDYVSLDIQLKCTSQDVLKNGQVSWPLSSKNYTELATSRRTAPAILIVLRVPDNFEEWIVQNHSNLTLARSAYWTSIRGFPDLVDQKQERTVKLSTDQLFNVEQLLGILKRVGDGGVP